MQWNNLSKLVDLVKSQNDEFGYFMAKLDYGFDQRSKINAATC